MMLLLATHRRAIEQDRMVREGRWAEGRPQLLQVPRLMGQTLGLIAFGHVARAVAERARAFGLRILAYDPFIDEMVILLTASNRPACRRCWRKPTSSRCICRPHPKRMGFLKEQHFRQMKKTAIFINTGRGPTVDEASLIKALEERLDRRRRAGRVPGGAREIRQPTHQDADNVILSPHIASASARFDPARRRRVGQELSLVLSGRWPMSCVNPTVLPESDLRRWQPVSMDRGPNS